MTNRAHSFNEGEASGAILGFDRTDDLQLPRQLPGSTFEMENRE